MSSSRIVGLDYGKKRIGVSISDPLRIFAQPYGTFSPEIVMQSLQRIQHIDGIEKIVIGWPLTEEGEEGKATASVELFVRRLTKAFPGVEIIKWDERYTSEMAKEAILGAGAKRKARRNKARVDAAAASIILQQYLDEYKD